VSDYHETHDEEKLIDLFNMFDRDGNGEIDEAELRTVMSAISEEGVSEIEV